MNSIDYSAWRFWWDVLQTLLLAGIGVYTWWNGRDRVTNSRISRLREETEQKLSRLDRAVDGRLDEHETRLARVESDCVHLPRHTDLGAIYERINGVDKSVGEVNATVADMGGEVRAMRRSLDLINQHLLESKR